MKNIKKRCNIIINDLRGKTFHVCERGYLKETDLTQSTFLQFWTKNNNMYLKNSNFVLN